MLRDLYDLCSKFLPGHECKLFYDTVENHLSQSIIEIRQWVSQWTLYFIQRIEIMTGVTKLQFYAEFDNNIFTQVQ